MSMKAQTEGQFLGVKEPGDEPLLVGLTGIKSPGGVGQLADETLVANDLGQPLERAHVSRQPHVNLLDGEEGVLGGEANAAGGDEVHPAPDTGAMHHRDHRLLAPLDVGERVLEVGGHPPQLEGLSSHVGLFN